MDSFSNSKEKPRSEHPSSGRHAIPPKPLEEDVANVIRDKLVSASGMLQSQGREYLSRLAKVLANGHQQFPHDIFDITKAPPVQAVWAPRPGQYPLEAFSRPPRDKKKRK